MAKKQQETTQEAEAAAAGFFADLLSFDLAASSAAKAIAPRRFIRPGTIVTPSIDLAAYSRKLRRDATSRDFKSESM